MPWAIAALAGAVATAGAAYLTCAWVFSGAGSGVMAARTIATIGAMAAIAGGCAILRRPAASGGDPAAADATGSDARANGRVATGSTTPGDLERRLAEQTARLADAERRLEAEIGRRESMQRLLEDARDQAHAGARSKSAFLALMSHELRTPLNAIIGFSSIIADEALGPSAQPKYVEYARDIHESGEHLLRIFNDMLHMARITAGTMTIQEAVVDPREAVADAARLVEPAACGAGVAIVLDLPPALPRLRADPAMMRQVLMNLVSNPIWRPRVRTQLSHQMTVAVRIAALRKFRASLS